MTDAMNAAKDLIIILLSSLLLTACGAPTMYSEFQSVSPIGWNADSVLTYSFHADNAMQPYDILLCVRHTETYPYQNMWLFCTFGADDSLRTPMVDTIEFYLADDRGRWLGNGGAKFVEMPVLFAQNYHFPDTGQYIFTIRHGMRDEQLRGITDIGVIVRSSEYGKE